MKTQFIASVLTGVVLTIHAPKTSAALLTYEFAGALDEPFGTLPAGTPFSGSFSYDDSQPLNTPIVPFRGDYLYTTFSVTIDGVTVTDTGPGTIHVYNTPYPTDMFVLSTMAVAGAFGGLTLEPAGGMQLNLQDVTRTAFDSPAIPGPCFTLDDFTTTGGATFLQLLSPGPQPEVHVRGEITDVFMSSVVNDQTVPTLVAAVANCHDHTVTVTFSEPMRKSTAEFVNNYEIANGITISSAVLSLDRQSVCLLTPGLVPATWYSLTVNGVTDRCGNPIAADSQILFSCPSEIRGRVFADQDSDCQFTALTDWLLGNWKVQLDPGGVVTTTDSAGEYYFDVAPGTYTISEGVAPYWAQTCPDNPPSYTIPIGAAQLVSQIDFVNEAAVKVRDLAVAMAVVFPPPLTTPCCEREMTYIISYENKGTLPVQGAMLHLHLVQGVTYQSFTANPPLNNPGGNNTTLIWNLPSPLTPGTIGLIYVKVKVDPCGPGATPLLIAHAIITPHDGEGGDQSNNEYTHTVQVACSYDPNDLQVFPKGCGPNGLVARDTLLTYLVLFQNMGSGPAHRVIIRDTLDPALDLSTVRVLASSHPYVFETTGQELVWTFNHIELPAQAVNEPGSHGFMRFEVHPRSDASVLTPISNTARIYFDLNDAVVTATTVNMLTDDPMPVATFAVSPASPANALVRDFAYTGGTPGADLQWDFGSGSVPATATSPNVTGVVFPVGVQRVILRVSVGGCEVEAAAQVFTMGSAALKSRILPLDVAQDLPTFSLAWDDWESETPIQIYSVYVSQDGGPYWAFQSDVSETTAVFAGQRGSTYRFYSRGRNLYGQREDVPGTHTASTTIRTLLQMSRGEERLVFTWDGSGQLQAADEISGPWNDVPNATSPHTHDLTEANRFFRISQPALDGP